MVQLKQNIYTSFAFIEASDRIKENFSEHLLDEIISFTGDLKANMPAHKEKEYREFVNDKIAFLAKDDLSRRKLIAVSISSYESNNIRASFNYIAFEGEMMQYSKPNPYGDAGMVSGLSKSEKDEYIKANGVLNSLLLKCSREFYPKLDEEGQNRLIDHVAIIRAQQSESKPVSKIPENLENDILRNSSKKEKTIYIITGTEEAENMKFLKNHKTAKLVNVMINHSMGKIAETLNGKNGFEFNKYNGEIRFSEISDLARALEIRKEELLKQRIKKLIYSRFGSK